MDPTTLGGMLDGVWEALSGGAEDAAHPAHRCVLATVAPAGGAAARMLVLRGADRAEGVLEVHTDLASAKIGEIRAEPRGSLAFWVEPEALQVRARCAFSVVTGPEVAPLWDGLGEGARLNYGGAPAPGMPLGDARDYREFGERGRFAVLRGRIDEIDAVHLGRDLHRRAVFARGDGFAGRWVGP